MMSQEIRTLLGHFGVSSPVSISAWHVSNLFLRATSVPWTSATGFLVPAAPGEVLSLARWGTLDPGSGNLFSCVTHVSFSGKVHVASTDCDPSVSFGLYAAWHQHVDPPPSVHRYDSLSLSLFLFFSFLSFCLACWCTPVEDTMDESRRVRKCQCT